MKSQLADKERLSEELTSLRNELEDKQFQFKSMELQVSTLISQKEQIVALLDSVGQSFPAESLREVFKELLESIYEGFDLEEEYVNVENDLIKKEGEVRGFAKREAEGLLSEQVLNIRKEVEQGRIALREINAKQEELKERRF